jgi:hypothetical protein
MAVELDNSTRPGMRQRQLSFYSAEKEAQRFLTVAHKRGCEIYDQVFD